MLCPRCASRSVKRGTRKTMLGKKQLYLCTSCKRKFTPSWNKMRFRKSDVLAAVKMYKEGQSSSKIQKNLSGRGVRVSRWTIIKWARKFG